MEVTIKHIGQNNDSAYYIEFDLGYEERLIKFGKNELLPVFGVVFTKDGDYIEYPDRIVLDKKILSSQLNSQDYDDDYSQDIWMFIPDYREKVIDGRTHILMRCAIRSWINTTYRDIELIYSTYKKMINEVYVEAKRIEKYMNSLSK